MGGVLTQKTKKTSQFTNFGVETIFFNIFLVFLLIFGFLGWHSKPKTKCQETKNPKRPAQLQCHFNDFDVATGFLCFYGEHLHLFKSDTINL